MVSREDMSKEILKVAWYGLHCEPTTMSKGEKPYG